MRPAALRRALAPAAVVAVVGVALVLGPDHDGGGDDGGDGRGDGGDARATPTTPATPTVTAQEFCDGFGSLAQARQDLLAGASPAGVRALHEAATEVDRLAAGTAMPDDAQAGVDFVVTALLGLDEDTTAEELVAADERTSLRDESHAEALSTYIADQCG